MRGNRIVRGGLAGAAATATTVLAVLATTHPVGATAAAHPTAAATHGHPGATAAPGRRSGVGRVRIAGRQAALLSRCLADARDGIIATERRACRQLARTAGSLRLPGSSVRLTGAGAHGRQEFARSPVTVGVGGHAARRIDVHITLELTGGAATAISNCVNDAQDGVIQTQLNSCVQYTSAGNIITLNDVTFVINL